MVAGTDSLRGTTGSGDLTGATANAPALAQTDGMGGAIDRDRRVEAGREDVIPVIEERLRVGKREVAHGAVRVRSYVVETPVEEQVRLREESVRVERRPVDRPTSGLTDDAFRERTIDVRATGEEAFVSKEARVVEEVTVHKNVSERTETVRDTTRRTEVEVDDGSASASGAGTLSPALGTKAGPGTATPGSPKV